MRLIRQVPTKIAPTSIAPSIDDIENPQLLAHALLDLGGDREEVQYPAYLRTSMLHDCCPRERVLGYRSKSFFKKATNTSMQLTFDLGTALHLFLQNSGKYFGNKRFGHWFCLNCGNKYFGRFPTAACKVCKAPPRAIQYEEHSIKLESPFRVTGHVDNFMEVSSGDIRVVDFKTINGEDFEKLKAPKGSHVIQISAYIMLMQLDKSLPVHINSEKGLVVYISKKHTVKTLPFKVFHVHRNLEVDNYITNTLEMFTRGIEDQNYLPPRHSQCVQTNFTAYRAKSCPMWEACQQAD